MKPLFYILILLGAYQNSFSQTDQLDKIVAIVGDKIILQSEVDMAISELTQENPNQDDAVCNVLDQYISQKILVEQASRDSVIISDDEIEAALDNRIRYFINSYGSQEKLEEISGKSVYQLKDDYRNLFRDQLTAQRMQGQIMQNVKITPQEVKVFYDKIPQDSLPFYPSMMEVGQIVFKPEINKEVADYAIKKLEDIREEIISGRSAFDVMASIHSEDPGSRDNGGELGILGRDDLVPEFAAAAFKLQNGEISPVVKTSYGYHIVQMQNRQGEKAKLRHILIKPLVTNDMVQLSVKKADSVRAQLVSGKLQFSEAVGKYSSDEQSKLSGGMLSDRQTGGTNLITEDLDPNIAIAVTDMKVKEFSQPLEYVDPQTGDRLVRVIYLKSRTEPHKANLTDDYSRIQQVALAEKQNTYLFNWIEQKAPTFFLKVDEEYKDCPNLSRWMKAIDSAKK
ncbi:MAG: peptidylprolyl isomerase [Chitinophagaceae bacterium]